MKLLRENVRVFLISCNHPRLHYESGMRQYVSSHISCKPHTFFPHFRVWTWKGLKALTGWKSVSWAMLTQMKERLGLTLKAIQTVFWKRQTRQHAFVVDDLEALELLCPSNSIARAFLLKVCKSCKTNDSKVTALDRGSAVHSVIVYGRKCSDSHEFTSGSWSISDPSSSSANSNRLLNPPLDHNLSPALSEYMRYRWVLL